MMQAKVPVGAATIAGYGATIIGLIAGGLVTVFNVDQEQAGLVASAVWTVVAFSWTQWGRYSQAKAAAERSSWGAEQPVAAKPRVVAPVKHIIADSWGWHPGVHDGIDLICPASEPLIAICHATVVRADAGGWWGLGAPADPVLRARGDGIIVLRSLVDAGPIRKGMNLCYGHAEHATVKAGQVVEAGDRIGTAGFANAWHVHFMVNMRSDAKGLGDRDPKPVVDFAVKGQ
jgi:murein DD-endopeptidase MepM/ murein hydrolase activator NlpD